MFKKKGDYFWDRILRLEFIFYSLHDSVAIKVGQLLCFDRASICLNLFLFDFMFVFIDSSHLLQFMSNLYNIRKRRPTLQPHLQRM